jgi:hypothetical protein
VSTQKPRKPAGLSPKSGRFFSEVTRDFDLRPDEIVILTEACRVMDVVDQLAAALRGQPLTVTGSAGQLREHPLLSESRQQRLALSRLVRQLDLPEAEDVAAIKDELRSRRNRQAARARWSA